MSSLEKIKREELRMRCQLLQNDVQLRRQYIQLQKKNALIQIEQALWVMNYIKDRLKRDPAYMYRIEVLERIIANEKKLYSNTGLYRIMFDALLEKFEEFLRSSNDSPLFRIKSNRSSHPGNRCKLYPRYALLITLIRLKTGTFQHVLAPMFGIDQSTVSDYLKFMYPVLEEILPSPNKMSTKIRKAETPSELKKILPGPDGGTVIVDATHVPVQRPLDAEKRAKMYQGRKKRFTLNTTVATNKDGLIVWIGKTRYGSMHDITVLKNDKIKFGRLEKAMKNPLTPSKKRMHVYTDKGYEGIEIKYPGIHSEQPSKKPRNGTHTKVDTKRNARISKKRVIVEHSIGRIKSYRVLERPYDRGPDELNAMFNVIAALVNFRLLWRTMGNRTLES